MDHPLTSTFQGLGFVLASLLSLFNSSAQAQVISGLTAYQSGTAIVLKLAEISSVSIDALSFYYSRDGGSSWELINDNCLSPVSSRSVEWAVLECMGIEEFTGDNTRFKASVNSCRGTIRFDGYDYCLVEIGNQCWFAENLRTTTYANGDEIPSNLNDSEWISTTSGAQAIYGKESSRCDGTCNGEKNLQTYGRLYNWYAVNDSRGICPRGSHVPTDKEWRELERHLGGSSVAGTAIRSSQADNPNWDGTYSSGFSALPGGLRTSYYGDFKYEGSYGYWWSASPRRTSNAWSRQIISGNVNVHRREFNPQCGLSIRCLRDE